MEEKTLFNQALKTYDLQIVLKVSEFSDRVFFFIKFSIIILNLKDPKEYLSLLNGLRKKSPFEYQCFHIDLILEDWVSALENLAKFVINNEIEGAEKFDECLKHIEVHQLHSYAFKIFSNTKWFKVKVFFLIYFFRIFQNYALKMLLKNRFLMNPLVYI